MNHGLHPVTPPPVPGSTDGWRRRAGFWLLLVTPLLLFWRPGRPLFFVHDDWTLLAQMANAPFREYLAHSRNEHWFPLFKVLFYGLAKVAGERHHLYVLVNCLLSGLNAVLVHHFLRLHLSARSALALAFLYAVSGGHPGTVWTAAYLQFILALTFFWGALLTAAAYVRRPTPALLPAAGLLALLSLLCNNFPLLALLALPLYPRAAGGEADRWKSRPLTGVVAAIYLIFAVGYLTCAGLEQTTFNQPDLWRRLPGWTYPAHFLAAAWLSPFLYLVYGFFHFPPWVFAAGGGLLGASLTAVWRWGAAPGRRLALFALTLNLLPFLLVSLARHQKSLSQAFVPRYVTFTLVGALLLLGLAAAALPRRGAGRRFDQALSVCLLILMLAGQFLTLPRWQERYLAYGREARQLYREVMQEDGPSSPDPVIRPWMEVHTPLSRRDVRVIGIFLRGGALHSSPPVVPSP